jgi:predicted nucleotidyltransferase
MAIQPFILAKCEQVAELCRLTHARRLDVFGSGVRDDFSETESDIDFLVEFDPSSPRDYANGYFLLKEGLEHLFHRPIDLLTPAGLKNPYLRARVEAERQVVYAA